MKKKSGTIYENDYIRLAFHGKGLYLHVKRSLERIIHFKFGYWKQDNMLLSTRNQTRNGDSRRYAAAHRLGFSWWHSKNGKKLRLSGGSFGIMWYGFRGTLKQGRRLEKYVSERTDLDYKWRRR